jgi:hypothetical protein
MSVPGFSAACSIRSSGKKYNASTARAVRITAVVEPQAPVGGGGGTNKSCADSYGDCYIGCSVDHPESQDSTNNQNADFRDACFESCDGGFRACRSAERSGHFGRLTAFAGTRFAVR